MALQIYLVFFTDKPILATSVLTLSLIQIAKVGFINSSVGKASFVRTFVYYHSIFHIVTSIRNYCNYCVCAAGGLIEIIVDVIQCSHERCLGEEQPINFIIHSVGMSVIWGSHCLFGHLTLVHVSWRLVVIAKRNS